MIKIDATNKSLGRLAAEIAKILQNKHRADFSPEKAGDEIVEVININRIKITGKKLYQKVYWRHSGYPGGIKKITLKELFEQKPQEALKKAVWGMLPKNKLRKQRIKRLTFK